MESSRAPKNETQRALGSPQAALCLTVCYFSQLANQPCLVVGTVYNMTPGPICRLGGHFECFLRLYPRHAPKATIKTYMYDEPGPLIRIIEDRSEGIASG